MGDPLGNLIVTILIVVPFWRICRRAGFHPALSLIAIIPLLGFIIVAGVLGFATWPTLKNREVR